MRRPLLSQQPLLGKLGAQSDFFDGVLGELHPHSRVWSQFSGARNGIEPSEPLPSYIRRLPLRARPLDGQSPTFSPKRGTGERVTRVIIRV